MSRFEREMTQYERLQALEAEQKQRIATGIRKALGSNEATVDYTQYLDPNLGFYHDTAARRMSHELPGIRLSDEALSERRSQMLKRLSDYATWLVHDTSNGADAIILQFPTVAIASYTEEPHRLPAVGN